MRLDKSPSTKHDKENTKIEHLQKTDRKFKLAKEHRVETDRKSMQKSAERSMKTIRLKTDYQELLSQQRDLEVVKLHQVSTMQTDDYHSKRVTISKHELGKLYKQAQKLMSENISLKKDL